MKTHLLKFTIFLLILAILAAKCNNEEEYPKEISFTEYALPASCQWQNLSYDEKVMVINSDEELKKYVSCAEGDYAAVDFSKQSILLVSGKTDNAIYSVNAKKLQQCSDDRYQLDIEVLLYDSRVSENWCIALVIRKINKENHIELGVNNYMISLSNTSWKLIGIVDTKAGTLQELEPKDCEKCYTLTFDDIYDAFFAKAVEIGCFSSCYNVDYPLSIIQLCDLERPDAEDIYDGEIFMNILMFKFQKTGRFHIRDTELKLYYNDESNYLLFKKINHEKLF